MDLSECTAALLFDQLNSEAASTRQTQLDNCKYPDELALEDPTHTAMLLMLRGVRSVVTTTLSSTPYTHTQAVNGILRGLIGGGTIGGPKSLGEATWLAQTDGLSGFELAAVSESMMVVYGLGSAVAGEGDNKGGHKGSAGAKGSGAAAKR
eukprot:GHRR01033671.1.p1 GENE.GHRR01033671.1~~GHRR01033671.1.p1  ORF type:complete len:151 (+),score=56.28 GHRR01033671.1:243-695(+)